MTPANTASDFLNFSDMWEEYHRKLEMLDSALWNTP
jgi:hypothetical protein